MCITEQSRDKAYLPPKGSSRPQSVGRAVVNTELRSRLFGRVKGR